MYQSPRFLTAGDTGLVVEFGDSIDPAINRRVRDLFVALQAWQAEGEAREAEGGAREAEGGAREAEGGEREADAGQQRRGDPASHGLGIVDLVPTYRSLLITYDPRRIGFDDLRAAVERVEDSLAAAPAAAPRVLEVPTIYGGPFGPDLAFVASHNSLTEDEVVGIHSGTDYLVYMMGFSPGFPYLGGMSERIATPRLKTPRTAIPAGSVGIAQSQTGIYPVESPGGWQLIGRTPLVLFDPSRTPPVLVEAGDFIRFRPSAAAEYERLSAAIRDGSWQPSFLEAQS